MALLVAERLTKAPELLLKPVIVELGATCLMRGLYLLDSEWETSPALMSGCPPQVPSSP